MCSSSTEVYQPPCLTGEKSYLLQGGLHVLGGELLLVHPPVIAAVQPGNNRRYSDTVIQSSDFPTYQRPGSIQSIGGESAGRAGIHGTL